MEDLTGRQLGPYRIVAPLGEGGMAAVYKAYQAAMDRYVAIKILPQQLARDPQFVARFNHEARVLAKLQHPHILPVHDFGEADGYTYIAMPFIESGTLTDLLHSTPLPIQQIRSIISQVGDALDYAHSRGLVHRDVKPSNVLVDERGNCLLTDFGIAKIVEGTVRFTNTGGILGTPVYMSPEQGRGQKLDGRSDIYSLGIMLYEMATGRVPFDAETPVAVIFKHVSDPLPPPRKVNPELPQAIERVILKALAKDPKDRYQTAGAMVEALTGTRAAKARPFRSAAGGAAGPPAKGSSRLPFPAITALIVVAGLLAAGGLAVVGIAAAAFLGRGQFSLPALQSPTPTVLPPSATTTRPTARPSPTKLPPTNTLVPTNTPRPTRTPTASPTLIPTATLLPGLAIVPNVHGLTVADAEAALLAAGFNSYRVQNDFNVDAPADRIYKQEPEAGKAASLKDTRVKIYNALHATLTPAPTVPPASVTGPLPGGARAVKCNPNGGPVLVANVRAWYIERYTTSTKQTIPQTGETNMAADEQAVYYRADDPNDNTLYVFCRGVNWPGP